MADNVIVRVPEQQFIRGEDGYSPEVTIENIDHGHSVNITDRDHPEGQSFNVLDGDSAYEQAVAGGYTGTEAQFNEELASFKELSEQAADSASTAERAAFRAQNYERHAGDAEGAARAYADIALIRMNSADQSAQSAAGSASNASRDAGTASTAATTATEKAGEASDSATAADGSAKDSEAYAVGKRNGTDVGSTDPAYHNNAKYYAQQASGSATAASGSATAAASSATAAGNAQTAAETAQGAAEDAQEAAEAVLASIPEDYTELSGDVDDLKSAIGYNLTPIAMQGDNKYIKTNGAVGTVVNTTPQTSSGFKYAIVPCTVGDIFTINATGGNSPRIWCFTDSGYVIISRDGVSNHTVSDLVLTAPENAAYLIINDSSDSTSYIGVSHITEIDEQLITLNQLTRGAFVELPAGANLNEITTVGNYYVTDANANSILNKPYYTVTAFNLVVESAYANNASYLRQYFIPRLSTSLIAVRSVRSNGTINVDWKLIPYDTLATEDNNGLLSKWDKMAIDRATNLDLFEKEMFPSLDSKMSGLLGLEKTNCRFHDNFYRGDNETSIGNNGSGQRRYLYYDMRPSNIDSENLVVGISNHRAVARNPYNVSGNTIYIKYMQTGVDMPYKVIMSFEGKGELVISPVDTSNYIYISATSDAFTVGGVGSFDITPVSVTHNLGLNTMVAYVYNNKINVYVAGQKRASVDVNSVNMFVGLLFRASEVDSIAYTNFDVFASADNLCSYQDEGIEEANSFSNEIVNNSSTADYSYGITLNTETTRYSKKSIRFEQRKEDSGTTYRSEITVKNPRGNGDTANYALQTKLFEYDLYIPADYGIDTANEILWQMHHTPDDVVADGLYPNIAFNTFNGKFTVTVRSFENKAQSSSEITHQNTYDLGNYVAGKWYHILVFIREGYRPEHNPCLAIWIDGELAVYTREVNAYNTTNGSYLKMGVYKPSYVRAEDTGTTKRVIYVDNLYVWM